ncbi:MAG TPA: pyridoxamine 5'-phosphate oxidase family protein [Candidatus Deferrimicrobium sp.]|nr:pyridoxamine 5'-phosphate oxidase family protein [Candidatus Deferrimicrobium sp.]
MRPDGSSPQPDSAPAPTEPAVPAAPGALTPAALDRLLREPIVARLGTVDAEGYPVVVPVWTEWDGEVIWLVVRAKADYAANLRARPKVGLSIVRADAADTRALVLGRAEIVAGPAPLSGRTEEIARRMAARYEGPAGDRYIEETRGSPRLLVRIIPDRIVSWGDPGWHPRYR